MTAPRSRPPGSAGGPAGRRPGATRRADPRARRSVLGGQRGVTLVELMVVVTIIAIIAAIAMSLYQDVQRKSKLAADQQVTAALVSAIAIYYGKHNGVFPTDLTAVEALVLPAPVWQCTVTVTYTPDNGKLVNSAVLADC